MHWSLCLYLMQMGRTFNDPSAIRARSGLGGRVDKSNFSRVEIYGVSLAPASTFYGQAA